VNVYSRLTSSRTDEFVFYYTHHRPASRSVHRVIIRNYRMYREALTSQHILYNLRCVRETQPDEFTLIGNSTCKTRKNNTECATEKKPISLRARHQHITTRHQQGTRQLHARSVMRRWKMSHKLTVVCRRHTALHWQDKLVLFLYFHLCGTAYRVWDTLSPEKPLYDWHREWC